MKSRDITLESTFEPPAPGHEEISLRAHQLWCQQGCSQGHDIDNWLEAQRQLLSEYANRTASMPASEDVENIRITRGDSPFAGLADEASFTTKVENQVIRPGRLTNSQSPTSWDL